MQRKKHVQQNEMHEELQETRFVKQPSKRKQVASLGGKTMHARHPDAARANGAKGGRTTAEGFADGPSAWGKRMALARWHGLRLEYKKRPEEPN